MGISYLYGEDYINKIITGFLWKQVEDQVADMVVILELVVADQVLLLPHANTLATESEIL